MAFVIRNEKPGDWPSLLQVMSSAFGYPLQWWGEHYPLLYDESRKNDLRHLVAEEEGKIIGSLGIYPDVVRIGGARLKNGGLGGVATLPEARGRGVMSALLEEANRQMICNGVDISLLGGDRLRYARYGWEPAGYARNLQISANYLRGSGVKSLPVRRHRGADAEQIQKTYSRCRWGSVRPSDQFFGRLVRGDVQVFCTGQDRKFVYAAGSLRTDALTVHEILGDVASMPGLLLGMMERMRVNSAAVRVPDFPNPVRDVLFQFAAGHSQSPVRQLQVVNLPSAVWKVRGLIETRMESAGWRGSVCLGIPQREQYVTLTRNRTGGVGVKRVRSSPCLELDLCAAARLLFGGLPGEFDRLRGGPFEILTKVFPLEWFFYLADCV